MKILKWIGIVLLLLTIGGAVFLYAQHESKPEVNPSPEADRLAQQMLTALNKEAWDTLGGLKWEFPRGHKYVWNKKANTAVISWGEHEVTMNLNDQSGVVKTNGDLVEGDDRMTLLKEAWSLWCNDSFWMFAPYKIFDPNTVRSLVKHEGRDALMVTYGGGGVTPGDSYLWLLDDNHIPTAYKMWVDIIPVGGMEFTWEDWKDLPGGAKVATKHVGDLFSIEMKGVEQANF